MQKGYKMHKIANVLLLHVWLEACNLLFDTIQPYLTQSNPNWPRPTLSKPNYYELLNLVFAASCSFPSIFRVNLFLWESSKAHQGKPPPPHFLIILHNPALYLIQYFSWKCKGLGMDQCWQNTTSLRFWEKTNLSRRYISYMSKWWRGGRFKAHLFPRCNFQAEECHILIWILQNWFFSQNSAMSSIFREASSQLMKYWGIMLHCTKSLIKEAN